MSERPICGETFETLRGFHLRCVREPGHAGPHSAGRCRVLFHQDGQERDCSLPAGHPGPHDSWVREADVEREYDRPEPRDGREDLGW